MKNLATDLVPDRVGHPAQASTETRLNPSVLLTMYHKQQVLNIMFNFELYNL